MMQTVVRKQGDEYPPIRLQDDFGAPIDLTDLAVYYQIAYADRATQEHRARILNAKDGTVAWPRTGIGHSTLRLRLAFPNGDNVAIHQLVKVVRA